MPAGPPPPFGHPWIADVGRNPNINRDPPPPPIDGLVPGNGPTGHIFVNAAAQQQQEKVEGVEVVPPGIGAHPIGLGMSGFGMGMPPFGMGMGMPGMMPGMGMMGMYNDGGLAPPQYGAYMKYPGLAGYGGLGMGMGGMMPGMGLGMGMGFPPPPLGIGGVVPPPFAPGNPLWAGGLGVGGMGMGMGLGMGGMMPGMLGMGMGFNEPVPGFANNAHTNGPPPQPQPDITVVSGGVPPGVTVVAAEEYTIVIHIKGMLPPWTTPGQPMACESLNVDSSTSLNRLIQVCRENEDCEGWAITECIELGSGVWEKGITFVYGTPTAITGTLKGVGWTNARNRHGGQSLHIFCHKV